MSSKSGPGAETHCPIGGTLRTLVIAFAKYVLMASKPAVLGWKDRTKSRPVMVRAGGGVVDSHVAVPGEDVVVVVSGVRSAR